MVVRMEMEFHTVFCKTKMFPTSCSRSKLQMLLGIENMHQIRGQLFVVCIRWLFMGPEGTTVCIRWLSIGALQSIAAWDKSYYYFFYLLSFVLAIFSPAYWLPILGVPTFQESIQACYIFIYYRFC